MAEEGEVEEGQEEGGSKSKKKLFIILGIVFLLLGAGVPAAFFFMGGEPEESLTEEEPEDEIRLSSFELDPIIVNLSQNSSFLKATIVVEYDEAIVDSLREDMGEAPPAEPVADGEPPDLLVKRVHHMRDSVIGILSSKTPKDVLSATGKERLKDEIVEGLNDASALDEGPIVAIYFLEFIVQ